MMSQQDDWTELRERIVAGRSGVREELYERLRSLSSLSPSFVAEEEFCNELYLRVVKRLLDSGAGTSGEEIRSIRAYCRASARHLRRALISEQSAAPSSLPSDDLPQGSEPATGRRMDLAAALESGLSELTPRERQVLWLADSQHLSPAQIVATLEREGNTVTLTTVYTRLARARRRLHAALVSAGYRASTARRWLGLFGGAALAAILSLPSLMG